MASVDDTYAEVVATLPLSLRASAVELPGQLGLTADRAGAWEAFVRLPATRDPIGFATEGVSIAPERTAAALRAYHAAGFYGIVTDRMSDNQVERTEALVRLRRAFRLNWERFLIRALGAHAPARAVIARALVAWRAGRGLEERGLRDRELRGVYAEMVRLKLGWIWATPCALLASTGAHARARSFARAYQLLLGALQLRDDVADAAEDERLRGVSVVTALGATEAGMIRAATILVAEAASAARAGGFASLAEWLTAYASEVDVFVAGAPPLIAQIEGMALAAMWGESIQGAPAIEGRVGAVEGPA